MSGRGDDQEEDRRGRWREVIVWRDSRLVLSCDGRGCKEISRSFGATVNRCDRNGVRFKISSRSWSLRTQFASRDRAARDIPKAFRAN